MPENALCVSAFLWYHRNVQGKELEWMQKLLTVKFWRFMIIILLAISLLPVFWIGLYNHSSADDYSYGCMARYAWLNTHNILETLKAAAEKVRQIYFEWQGSYGAVFLFALQPAVFGEQFYPLGSFLILGFFLFAVFYFFRKAIRDVFHANVHIADVVAGVAALLCIQMMPAPVEGFFWWNGSIYYVFFYSLMLVQAVNLMAAVWYGHCGLGQLAGFLLLAAAIAGGDYITALLMMELTVFFFVWALATKKRIMKKLALLLAVTLVCFLVNCLAPGNAVRQGAFESWNPIRAVLYSYHEAYNHMVEWTSPLVVAGMVFLLPFLWQVPIGKLSGGFGTFVLFLGMEFSFFASSFTPTLYTYGDVGAGRIQNIRYFLWVFICIAAEFTLVCLIKTMFGCQGEGSNFRVLRNVYNRYGVPFFASVVFCAAFFAGNSILADDVRDLASISAAKSLLSGEAAQYHREAKERISLLQGEGMSVELTPFSCKPELLFWEDIKEDPDDWVNRAVARFYQKEEVRLR